MKKDLWNELQSEFEHVRDLVREFSIHYELEKRDLSDKIGEIGDAIEAGYERAKAELADLLTGDSDDDAKDAHDSLHAGWRELRAKHEELAKEARERAERESL